MESARAPWQHDNETANCIKCARKFTFFMRRHHCRSCGGVYCSDCCGHKAQGVKGYSKDEYVRVCTRCYTFTQAGGNEVAGGDATKKKRKGGRVRQRKILLIGAKGCGKTSIMSRYTRNAMPDPGLESSAALGDGTQGWKGSFANGSMSRNGNPLSASQSAPRNGSMAGPNAHSNGHNSAFEFTVLAKGQEYCLSLEEVCYDTHAFGGEDGPSETRGIPLPGEGDGGGHSTEAAYGREAGGAPVAANGARWTSDFDPRWAIGVAAIVVVYAVDDHQSLAMLQRLREEMLLCGCLSPPYDRNCQGTSADIVTVLVGNKADVAVSNREVEAADAQHLARAWGVSHFEVSAKSPNYAATGGSHKPQSQAPPLRAYGPTPSAHDSQLDAHHPLRSQSQGGTSSTGGGGGTVGHHGGNTADGTTGATMDIGDTLHLPGLFFEPRLASEDHHTIEGLFQYLMAEIGRRDGT